MDESKAILLVVVVSEVVAVVLIRSIWRSHDYTIAKVLMSVVALIPVVGTLGVLWAFGFPSVRNRAYQNRSSTYNPSLEVFDRWKHVFDEKDKKKKESISRLLNSGGDDEEIP